MKSYYNNNIDLLRKKGCYPYEWVNSIENFDDIGLPPIGDVYISFSMEGIDEKIYMHDTSVYNTMDCKTFKHYQDIYIQCDVLLLAAVFEKLRYTCHSYYSLDPASDVSAPGLAWDAMLLMTGIKLDLIDDREVLDMLTSQQRGVLTFVGSQRYTEANRKCMPTYDPEKKNKSIIDYVLGC